MRVACRRAIWSHISRSRIVFLFAFRSAFGSQRMDPFCAVIAFAASKKFPQFTVGRTLHGIAYTQTHNGQQSRCSQCWMPFFFVSFRVRGNFSICFFVLPNWIDVFFLFLFHPLVDGWFEFVTHSWWLNSIVARHCGRSRYHSRIVHMSLHRVFVSGRWCAEKKNTFRWNLCIVKMRNMNRNGSEHRRRPLALSAALNLNTPRSHCNESS